MSVQTSYDKDPAIGLEGQIADTHQVRDEVSRLNNEDPSAAPGLLIMRGSADDDESARVLMNPVTSPDVDAFITTKSSPSTETVFDGGDLDGVLDGDEHAFGWFVDLVLDASADWNATTATLKAKRASDGAIVEEEIDIPDGGNATVSTTEKYCKVVSLTIPAQGGTGGSFTLGISGDPDLNRSWVQGVSVLRTAREDSPYDVDEVMPVLRRGRIFVRTETAVNEGDRAFARHTAPGDETLGEFRNDADGGNAAMAPARFSQDADADSIVKLEVDVPALG